MKTTPDSNADPCETGTPYTGDLYEVGRPFAELIHTIEAHLEEQFSSVSLKVSGSNKVGNRRVNVTILSAQEDLTDTNIRNHLITEISTQVRRFGFDKSNLEADYRLRAFSLDISISDAFWARRQRTSGEDLIEDKIKLATFKRELKPGHLLEVMKGVEAGRKHRVLTVDTRIIVDDGLTGSGRFYWDFPKAYAFLCDGKFVRISQGTTTNPDAYLLLNWTRP